ncbi:alpha/beta hydrolase [Nocardia sp. NPDC019395]|uniref:alpha/beta hydrolase n=1 Tax=Nocardia sp. NPDC019395 TaxID=3154686 RepID=UPI0033DD7238
MNSSGPGQDFPEFFPMGVRRGVLDANLLAQRLEKIVTEMGTGISDTLYRRTQRFLLDGDRSLVISDADNASVLRRLMDVQPPARSASARSPVGGIPDNARDVHSWWSGLSEREKQELFRADPFIGNTDGIPQRERDIYNRKNLRRLWDQAHIEKDRDSSIFYDDLKYLLHGQPHLLSHLGADGRFAVSRGNPDISDNAVVFLRPAGNFKPVDFAEETMSQIRQSATLADPNASTSVTFWSNYDNPTTIIDTIFPHFATDGAAAVRSYHDGLRATHIGPPAHTTTIGYSYGSVLAGHSAGHGNALATDDMIFLGSWGTGVDNVGDLGLAGVESGRTADHVYAAMAPHDPLQLLPNTHGAMPTTPEFGAPTFAAESAPGVNKWNLLDHNVDNYFSSANPSSRNIGLIATGHGDQVERLQ